MKVKWIVHWCTSMLLQPRLACIRIQMESLACLFMTVAVLVQNKEEVMAVRLREVDGITAVLELQQRVAELEIEVSKYECRLLEAKWN